MCKLQIVQRGNFFRQVLDSFPVEFNDFPGTCPHALPTVRAPFLDDGDLRFLELNRILRTHTHTAAAVIAFAGSDMNHQKWFSHENLSSNRSESFY